MDWKEDEGETKSSLLSFSVIGVDVCYFNVLKIK